MVGPPGGYPNKINILQSLEVAEARLFQEVRTFWLRNPLGSHRKNALRRGFSRVYGIDLDGLWKQEKGPLRGRCLSALSLRREILSDRIEGTLKALIEARDSHFVFAVSEDLSEVIGGITP